MPRYNDVSSQLTPGGVTAVRTARPSPVGLQLLATIFLALATLACGLVGPTANEVVFLRHLPTLTRTALPTLSPTPSVTPVAELPSPGPVFSPDSDLPVTEPATPPVAVSRPPATSLAPPASAAPAAALAPPVTKAPATALALAVDTPPASSAGTATAPVAPPAVSVEAPPSLSATSSPTPSATSTPANTATALPSPTPTPLPSPTATPMPAGWVFSGIRNTTDPKKGTLLFYGDLINNTGLSQNLAFMTGTFYDDQGQQMPDRLKFVDWPVKTVPQGGQVPFELTVTGVRSAANFDLKVEASPSEESPRQDFEFLDLNPAPATNTYCINGKVRNSGTELQKFLTVVAVLYDSQENVINFNDYYKYSPRSLVGEQMLDFNVCVETLDQEVARYDLRAWGL